MTGRVVSGGYWIGFLYSTIGVSLFIDHCSFAYPCVYVPSLCWADKCTFSGVNWDGLEYSRIMSNLNEIIGRKTRDNRIPKEAYLKTRIRALSP